MNKLQEIINLCKCGVYLTINEHKNCYEDLTEKIVTDLQYEFSYLPKDPEVLNKMIELDTIIVLQCYVHTPVGSATSSHYDLEILLSEMLEYLKKEAS